MEGTQHPVKKSPITCLRGPRVLKPDSAVWQKWYNRGEEFICLWYHREDLSDGLFFNEEVGTVWADNQP